MQKIDNTILKTYGMIVLTFSILDKNKKEKFFIKSFLLTNINLNIVLELLFLIINYADIDFQAKDL